MNKEIIENCMEKSKFAIRKKVARKPKTFSEKFWWYTFQIPAVDIEVKYISTIKEMLYEIEKSKQTIDIKAFERLFILTMAKDLIK